MSAATMTVRGCYECAWGKVAGCWRCGSRSTPIQDDAITLRIGGKYNWRNQPERLVYIGSRHYSGDRRRWHQFAKVETPSVVWSEVLDEDLSHFEATEGPAP